MKFMAAREALLKPLQAVIGVVERHQTMPILANVLLVAKDGELSVTATDLEVGIRLSITRIQVETTGSILVPADKLGAIVRECDDETLAIEVADNICHIRGSDSHFQVFAQDAKEFPPVAELERVA